MHTYPPQSEQAPCTGQKYPRFFEDSKRLDIKLTEDFGGGAKLVFRAVERRQRVDAHASGIDLHRETSNNGRRTEIRGISICRISFTVQKLVFELSTDSITYVFVIVWNMFSGVAVRSHPKLAVGVHGEEKFPPTAICCLQEKDNHALSLQQRCPEKSK